MQIGSIPFEHQVVQELTVQITVDSSCHVICLHFITPRSHFLLSIRCPDGSHQLVWDAVPADTRQRVPQSGASAAGIPAGLRALKLLSSTRNTQLPLPPRRQAASRLWCFPRDCTTCISLTTSGYMSFLSVFFNSSFPLHSVIIWLCQLENTEASDQTAKLSGRILNNVATVEKIFFFLN